MRKLLLLTLALCFGFFAVAQKTYQLQSQTKIVKVLEPGERMTTAGPADYVTSFQQPAKPPVTDNVNAVSVVDIGSAANLYTYGYANGAATFTWYNKDINAVSNFHRMGGPVGPPGQYSGDLCYDLSTDGGMTWTNQTKIYTSNISGGTYNLDAARYPQGAIYNPAGNTDPNNAYMAYFACTLEGSNGGTWGGYAFGVGNIGDPLDTTKHLLSSDLANGYYQGIPTAFTITQQDGVAMMADASLLDSYTEYLGDIIFMRGVFDEGEGDYIYEEFLSPAPCDYARYLKMAFDPTGQIGYVLWNSYIEPEEDWWSYPCLIKSEDGGETWGDLITVNLWGPDGIDGIKNWLTDEMIATLWEAPLPTRDEIMYTTPWFNSDISVDAWGNPHMALSVFIGGPGLDPGYVLIEPESFAVFDIYSIDDENTDWQAVHLGTLETYEGIFQPDDFNEYNRIQVASTWDGTKMFFTWLDTRLENVTENISPDIYARGFDLVDNMITLDEETPDVAGAKNVTYLSEAMWGAYFQSTSHYVIDEGDEGSMTYTIPMVYCDMDPQDITLPVQFKYIKDFYFMDGDFVLETGNPPITGVGIGENKEVVDISVSQNYPNPFNNTSMVVVELDRATELSFVVTNMIGQKVMEIDRGQVSAGSHNFTIDASKLHNGIYFYTVIAGDQTVTRKMIIE